MTPKRSIIANLHGNLKGIRTAQQRALERTSRRRVRPDEIVSPELARHLTELSRELNRQIGVLLTRDGEVQSVIVGTAGGLDIPEIGRLRGGAGRFRALRLVHTHLKGEPLSAEDLNDLALLRLDLVAVVQALENGLPGPVEVAWVLPDGSEEATPFRRDEAPGVHQLDIPFEATIRALEREFARVAGDAQRTGEERALVVATRPPEALDETLELVGSAGVVVAGTVTQRRRRLHPRTVVGRGKLADIVLEGMRRQAEVVIFDVDLKPAQARAFEDATGMKAIDRTQLILDIFAQRARSRDGKLQVELAQLKYSLPRLTEQDEGLSRLTGGIGGRGPGETVMEIGRRRIRDRIAKLEKQVRGLARQRDLRRKRRRDGSVPVLSIIGYTNAGKSTLLNALTRSEIAAADKLFMTLDPTSRRLRFPRWGEVVVTDTVGFLRDLPADLIDAFRATLEELADADVLLHVVDASDREAADKLAAVEKILEDLGVDDIPTLVVLNKIDRLSRAEAAAMERRFDGVGVSALRRQGLERLLKAAEDVLGGVRLGSRPAAAQKADSQVSGATER